MTKRWLIALTACVLGGSLLPVQADVILPPMFSNNMVLQQGQPAPVWGKASPGEKVTIEFKAQKKSTVADKDGKWRIDLDPMPASPNPVIMRVWGKNRIELKNVVVGEVWLCAGGVNMAMTFTPNAYRPRILNHDAEIAAAKYPAIRFFTIPAKAAPLPVESIESGSWQPVTPTSIRTCSATAYFFARHLYRETRIPVGIMIAAWANTRVEAWSSYGTLKKQPDFKELAGRLEKDVLGIDKAKADYAKAMADWKRDELSLDPGEKSGWHKPFCSEAGWQSVMMPSTWEKDPELKKMDYTAVWYRRTLRIPEGWNTHKGDLILKLGKIDDEDITWVNGVEVGRDNSYLRNRSYTVPEKAWKNGSGSITIAIRLYDQNSNAGFTAAPKTMKIHPSMKPQLAVLLDGEWVRSKPFKIKRKRLPKKPKLLDITDPVKHPYSLIYNGMIHPLAPYGIRGMIWSQGEANRFNPDSYRIGFPAMVADWRKLWAREFPVYYGQIAPYPYPDEHSTEYFQEIQAQCMKAIPNSGMACSLDLGHVRYKAFPNKQEAGRRLALWALAKTYKKPGIVHAGPRPLDATLRNGKVYLRFANTNGVLVVRGEELNGFSVAGTAGVYMPAKARLEGESIVVWSDLVQHPAYVRYGNQRGANKVVLTNGDNLPTVPFCIQVDGTR